MKFLALISGGKDSVYNIIRCVQEGHELVLLVNLYPKQIGIESDSFMYQSVGTNAIQAIAQAMDKPLMTREISGTPKITNLDYQSKEEERIGDEVEDLYLVLKEALTQYPDIKGVSSGAIASTYQKLRVEDCCNRLGLASLAYLWNQDQFSLLDQMLHNNMNIILIKIAAMGLTQKHLGKTIQELYDYFKEINKKFGFHPCGEGGEFESFVLDCPLYKKRIQINETEVICHEENSFAPVYYLLIKKYELIEKN
ncbi:unnamed protein product (macronuclear) [Paramecium tetraurelia]|uniref:Diphthine--ammonia ligase n=1 Tax=Paramecium tetraurelia TaxID=5888 RepID=A0D3G8_PARTE|nr:uncharacterized protein GSPATT00013073001 [Paramecium tetraurelia]CAK77585.1 unnamed protein product [Paramecium tetraurelia]|eukprot:XP_001444982.1 hypothetical protein (macronuclear) [Paramecium tetraurelia strain d4-2]